MLNCKDDTVQVMLDIETLSTNLDAVIVSIGAVKFTIRDGIIDTFLVNIDPVDSKKYGLHTSKDTIIWWSNQSKEARRSWQKNQVSLAFAMQAFIDWYGQKSIPTWCKGATFDYPIIESSLKAAKIAIPWKYWHCNCYRSIINFFGIDDRNMQATGTTHHDAVSDCKNQCNVLLTIFRSFKD